VDLSLNQSTVDAHVVVEVRGEVDVHSAPQLRDRLIEVIDDGNNVVLVDLSGLAFIDSTGLGALVEAMKHAKSKQSSLRIVCAVERVLRLFRITGLHAIFAIYPTIQAAIVGDESSTAHG